MLYSKSTANHSQHIIFIHGNSQSHLVWDAVINDTSLLNYTKVAVDLPGHGQSFRSDHPEKDYTLRAMAQHIADFTNLYSEKEYILVASSLATNYIAEKAHAFENCKGFFLLGACVIGENIMPSDIILPNPNFGVIFSAKPSDAELDGFMSDEAYHVTAELKQELKTMFWDTDPNLRVQLGLSIANQEYGDEIGNLWKENLPVAVVYGADDKIIYPDYMQNSALKLWKDRIIKIPKAGHCPHLDEPGLIADMIAEFAATCFK